VTDFEIVPGTPTTYDVNVTVNSVVESEVTPGLTGIASRVAAVESRTVAGVPATAGDYPLAALIAAGLGGTDGDPITCPPGEMTDVVVVGGNIVNRKYVYAEIVEDGGSPPGLGLPPAHLHLGKVIVQTTEQYGSSGPLVEVIPPDPDRRPALDFTTWFRALDTTDFGAGDSVDFDLDGATVTATFTGVMDKSEIITALLTPLVTAGATNSGLVLSSPTEGGSISITDPGSVLDFSAVQAYGLGGYIRTIDNSGGGKDADAYFGVGTDNPDYELVGVGYSTHSSPTGANDIKRSAVVLSIPDPSVFLGARWTAVVWPDRSEFVPYSLENGGNNWYSNTHDMMDRLVDFQADTPGTYAYEVELVDVDGVNVPTITLVAPAAGGSVATDPIFTSKGDLPGGTGSSTAARLAVGANGQVLTAASGEATGLKWASVPGAVRVIAASRTTGSTVIATPVVPVDAGATTRAIALGEQLFCRAIHSGQTLTKLYVMVSATSLTGSQTIEVCCYNDLGDGTPGTRAWTQNITVGTSTGTLDSGTVSLAVPTGACWFSILNPSGNAGTVTLRTGNPTTSPTHTQMANGSFTPVWNLTGVASATSDASAYLIRSASTGSTVYGVDAATTFPVLGAIA